MSNLPSASGRPVAAAKSRKNLLKQQSSIGGRSHTQPVDRTPLPADPSNAQFSFTFGTISAEGSSLPTAPGALSYEDNARFPFTSGTLPAEESSLPTAPVAFGNKRKAQFDLNFGVMPAVGSSLPAEPLVFGMQSDAQFSFTSGAVPAEGTSLPAAPSVSGTQSNAQYALNSGTQPEESIEKMVADLEAEMVRSPGLSVNTQLPHDPNYGLDMTFGLDIGFVPAIPNVGQDSNATHYPDPSDRDSGCSLPYFAQDSNIQDPNLPHSSLYQDHSFHPGLEIAQDPFAQDPSFDQKLSFPLDPSFGNYPSFAASTQPPDPSASQNPDANFQDNTRSLPSFIQDSLELALDPFGLDLFGLDPFGLDPFAQDPFAQDPFAQDPSIDQMLNIPLDPIFDPANEPSNNPPFAASTQPPDPSATHYSDPNSQGNTRSLPYFIQDSSIRDPDLPQSTFHKDASFVPGLDITHDPIAQDPSFDQKLNFPLDLSFDLANEPSNYPSFSASTQPPDPSASQNPDATVQDNTLSLPSFIQNSLEIAHNPFALDPFALDPFAQDPFAQDPSTDQNLNILLDPISDPANEPSNNPPFAASTQPPAPSATQYSDPNVQDNTRSLPYFSQDASIQDPDLPHPSFYQDPSFPAGLDIAQDPVAQDPSLFPLDPNFDIVNEGSNSPPCIHDSTIRDPELPCPKSSPDPEPTVDPSLVPNTNVLSEVQHPVAHDSNHQQESTFTLYHHLSLANELDNSKAFANQQRFPQMSSTALDQHVHGNEDSQFDIMDIEPDFKTIPLSWKQNQLTDEVVPKANAEEKRSTVTSSTGLLSEISIPATSIDQAVTIDQREIQRLRAEIERKNKEISDKDDKIRRSTRDLEDQDTRNMQLIKQFRGDLDKLRIEKSTLEEANHSLARENSETKENQGKAKKDTELIRKLNCELGRIRKKQSALVKANESLDKDCSELRGESHKLCESNSILKEENCRLRASLDDHHTSRSELVEAKETIRAQEAELQNSAQRIATLSACIDEISPKLLWRTEELQEAEECVLHEESVSKYYRDRCCLLWDKCNALESAGDSRETEFAKLEMEEEQRHTKELEALNLQIRDLEVANKRLAQRAGDVGGSADIKEADKVDEKIQELPLPKGRLDKNQEPPKTDEEPLKKSLRLRQEELKARRKEMAKELFERGKALKLRAAHEAKPEKVAALSITVEDSGLQDGTPATPHTSAPAVPKADETTGEEGTTAQTAPPTRSLLHNFWSMILWYKGLSHKWEWAFLALFIILVLVVGIIGVYLSYLDAVITILDEAVYMVPQMVERDMPAVAVRRYMQRGLAAAGVPGL